ncbi:MAG: ABC transporter permease [Planctomycetes bacterium]|nr:ABC transporter permease [Planctomycetota bacterium]
MSALAAFLAKEGLEVRRTWRIWVLPGLILFAAIASPVAALLLPLFLEQMAGSQPGVFIRMPDPVALDACEQFLKNLNQIVLVALVLAGAGAVSGERRAGTAALVLTKPLGRGGFVFAKLASQAGLLAAATGVGTAVCAWMTLACFGTVPVGALLAAAALWLALALFLTAVTTLLSAALANTGAAAGLGMVAYLLLLVAGVWAPLAAWSPAGLPAAAGACLDGGDAPWAGPLVTALLGTAAAGAGAVLVFRRAEL